MVGGKRSAQQVVTDVVVLPVRRIVACVRARVAPVAAEVVPLVGGARSGQREQVARGPHRDLADERLRLGHGDRSARRGHAFILF